MQQCRSELSWLGYEAERRPAANTCILSSGVGLFCSTRSGVGLFCRFQLELQQFCVKPFVGHANLIRWRYWRLEERRDGAVSRVVSVFFCAVYIVLLGQCYVAMPSGYKLVITYRLAFIVI